MGCCDAMKGRKIIFRAQGETGEDPPLMIRYVIWESARFAVWLHQHLRSDTGPLHDHPWGYWSLVLWGWHWEEIAADYSLLRLMGSWRYRPASWVHRIRVHAACWTLVLRGRKVRDHQYYPATPI